MDQKTTTSPSCGLSNPLNNQTTLIAQPMDVTTLDTNISVLNAEIPHTSNGIALSTPVEPVTK
jgi:hypothetical protein